MLYQEPPTYFKLGVKEVKCQRQKHPALDNGRIKGVPRVSYTVREMLK